MARDLVRGLHFRKASEAFDAQALSKALEQGYLAQRRETKHTQKKTFSPSNIGGYQGVCPRYWYLAFTGGTFIDDKDAMSIATMSTGSDAGKRIAKAFKDAGVLVADEVEIKLADPPVRGFVDVLIKWDNEVVVGEIKNTRHESWIHRQTKMKPTAQHLLQLLIYLRATGKKKGFLLYENRNSLEIVVIPVAYDEKNEAILEAALEWMRTVRKSFDDKKLPERPYRSKNSKVCKDCPVRDWCWDSLPDGDVKIPAMEVVEP